MAAGLYTQNWYCTFVPPVASAVRVMGVFGGCGEAGEVVTLTAVNGELVMVYQSDGIHFRAGDAVPRGDGKQVIAGGRRCPGAGVEEE